MFEAVIAKFEHDCLVGSPGKWQDYLPEDPIVREWLMAELPLIEAELISADETAIQDAEAGETARSSPTFQPTSDNLPLAVETNTIYGPPLRKMRGGLGDVWVVPELSLGRTVVVKQLQDRWHGNAKAERAFLQEVKITSLLEHPGIVPVHATGRSKDGRPFYSMRYVEGQTLREAISALHAELLPNQATLRKLLNHFVTVCRTIAYAHSCGVLHRDLKPENIIIGCFGQTVVLDWGLAKQFPERAQLEQFEPNDDSGNAVVSNDLETSVGDILGTPAYMSPEQARGDIGALSIQTDVYGLGAILYTILFGTAPFATNAEPQPYESLSQRSPEFPACRLNNWFANGLIAICRKSMALQPHNRYADASLLADEVENWLSGENISVKQQPLGQRLMRWAVQQRTLAGAAVLFACLALTSGVYGMLGIQRERNEKLLATRTAQANAQAMESAAEYISKVFQSAEPLGFDDLGFSGGGQIDAKASLRQMLEQGFSLVDDYYHQQPEQKSEMLLAMGHSFRGLAEYDQAQAVLDESAALRLKLFGEQDARTLECYYHLGRLAYDVGEYSRAEELLRHVIHVGNSLKDRPELLVADAQFHLARLLYYQPLGLNYPQFKPASIQESKQMFAEVINTRERLLGKNHPSVGYAYAGYAAACFNDHQKAQEALTAVAKAMEVFRANGQNSKLGHFLLEYLRAEKLRSEGNVAEAEAAYCLLRETIEEHLGKNHPIYLMHLWNMAGFYHKFHMLDDAELTIEQIRELARDLPGFRSSQAHLDGLRQYVEELMKDRPKDAMAVLEETIMYARERPTENASLIEHLQSLLTN